MSFFSLAAVILICTIWGAGFAFMKIALQYLPPFLYVGLRFLLTSGCLILYMRLLRVQWRFPRRLLGAMVALILLFYLQQGLIFLGLLYTTAGRMGVILNTQPIITAIAAHWFVKHDRLTWGKAVGLLMAIAGVFFVFRESFTTFNRTILGGDMMALAASISWGIQTIVTKHVVKRVTPSAVILWQSAASMVLFFLTSILLDPDPVPKQPLDAIFWVSTAYLILIATVLSFVWWVYLIRHNNPSQVTSFCFITPVMSVVFAWLLLGERITQDIVAATAMVGAGIFVANFPFPAKGAAPPKHP